MRANKKYSDEKMTKSTEEFKTMIEAITDNINNLKYLPNHKYPPNTSDSTTVVPSNRRSTPLESGKYTKIGGI